MGAIEILPSLKAREPFDEARFLRFLEGRPDEERWELIDGEPVQMMTPASIRHQVIAVNLERLLNDAFEAAGTGLLAVHEVGLAVDGYPDFRAVADLAVISLADEDHAIYARRFRLVVEILSASNTSEHISLKRARYAECPDCLHVLIIGQEDTHVEVWSRSNDWQGRVYRSPDDRIELPEFGLSCVLKDLYRGTPIK